MWSPPPPGKYITIKGERRVSKILIEMKELDNPYCLFLVFLYWSFISFYSLYICWALLFSSSSWSLFHKNLYLATEYTAMKIMKRERFGRFQFWRVYLHNNPRGYGLLTGLPREFDFWRKEKTNSVWEYIKRFDKLNIFKIIFRKNIFKNIDILEK